MLANEAADFPKTHDLKKLWELCREIITNGEPSASNADLEAIDESIAQFCAIDNKSEAFRYPVDREGKRSIPDELSA